MNKQQLIKILNLQPHPEGGYYHQVYESKQTTGQKSLFTSIYFLIESGNISHFHQLKSDEVWYFHGGDSLTIHMIHSTGKYEQVKLGLNVTKGEVPQHLVPAGTIFASTVEDDNQFSFVGCMVAPGFTYEDFKMNTQSELLEKFPEHTTIIKKYAVETTE